MTLEIKFEVKLDDPKQEWTSDDLQEFLDFEFGSSPELSLKNPFKKESSVNIKHNSLTYERLD